MALRVKKDDLVYVVAGKEKGKTGKVLKLFRSKNKATVEGLNIVKRHTKPTQEDEKGGIVEKEAPIQISNLLLFCEKCQKGVRTRCKTLEDDSKVRCCSKCGEEIIS